MYQSTDYQIQYSALFRILVILLTTTTFFFFLLLALIQHVICRVTVNSSCEINAVEQKVQYLSPKFSGVEL